MLNNFINNQSSIFIRFLLLFWFYESSAQNLWHSNRIWIEGNNVFIKFNEWNLWSHVINGSIYSNQYQFAKLRQSLNDVVSSRGIYAADLNYRWSINEIRFKFINKFYWFHVFISLTHIHQLTHFIYFNYLNFNEDRFSTFWVHSCIIIKLLYLAFSNFYLSENFFIFQTI